MSAESGKRRCQAYLLTPHFRAWAEDHGNSIRCKYNAKEDSNFCGNHRKLEEFIDTIIWKEDINGKIT
jgi:hypothetical protein